MGMQRMMFGSAAQLTLSLSSNTALGFAYPPFPSTALSQTISPTVSGGSGSYTYAWAYVSGDNTITRMSSATSANQSWSKSLSAGATANAIWRLTVSDGLTSVSDEVSVELYANA